MGSIHEGGVIYSRPDAIRCNGSLGSWYNLKQKRRQERKLAFVSFFFEASISPGDTSNRCFTQWRGSDPGVDHADLARSAQFATEYY